MTARFDDGAIGSDADAPMLREVGAKAGMAWRFCRSLTATGVHAKITGIA